MNSSSYRGGDNKDAKIYVGNLPPDIKERDIDDLFCKFGRISYIELKNRRGHSGGPAFAFVEFEDPRDAHDAIKQRDNYNYDGYTLRVEYPKGPQNFRGGDGRRSGRPGMNRGGMGGRSGGGGGGGGGGGMGGGSNAGPSRRTEHRVFVKGLPPTGSWQDLKDHMREAGDVAFADVFKDGTGMVEFLKKDDMKYAVKKLDDTEFRSHEGEKSFVRVIEDKGGVGGSGSGNARRSRSFSRSKSRSPSPRKSRASPRYSPYPRSRSRSNSRVRSRPSPY